MRPHGIMFHHFCDDRHPAGQGAIAAQTLRQMIQHLGPRRILPAQEWMDRALSSRLPDDAICLSFDDNLLCQYDIALPVLREFGLRAFWFCYTSVIEGNVEPLEIYRYFRTTYFTSIDGFYDAFFQSIAHSPLAEEVDTALQAFEPSRYLPAFGFYTDADRRFRYVRDEVLGPERYRSIMDAMIESAGADVRQMAEHLWMTADHLRELQREGHVIGLHSHTHPTRLQRMDRQEQFREYAANHTSLTQILGIRPRTVSHPCNSYDQRALSVLRELGIRLGFRANMALIDGAGPLEFPREDHANVLRAMRQAA